MDRIIEAISVEYWDEKLWKSGRTLEKDLGKNKEKAIAAIDLFLAVARSNEVLERQIRILKNRCRELENENRSLKQRD